MNEPFQFKQLQKKIKQQRYKRGSLFLIAVVLLTTLLFLGLPKFVNLFFYDPRESNSQVDVDSYIMNRQINNELTTQNLFLANYELRALGFGKYEITEVYQNLNQSQTSMKSYQLNRNHLVKAGLTNQSRTEDLFEARMRNSTSPEFSDSKQIKQNLLANLEKLPKSTTLIASLIFEKDLSLEELTEWRTYQLPKGEIIWTAVRTGVPGQNQDYQPLGFATSFSRIVPAVKETSESFLKDFPFLGLSEGTEEQEANYSETEKSAAHFGSMLKYLLSQKDFLALEPDDNREILSTEQIQAALNYIQKNGINSYGITVALSVDELINLLKNSDNLLAARVTETTLFSLINQDSLN
jgi:hypothetical protein